MNRPTYPHLTGNDDQAAPTPEVNREGWWTREHALIVVLVVFDFSFLAHGSFAYRYPSRGFFGGIGL